MCLWLKPSERRAIMVTSNFSIIVQIFYNHYNEHLFYVKPFYQQFSLLVDDLPGDQP
jgi:hypothetical protein